MAKKQRVESLSYPIIKHSIERLGGWYYKPPDTGFVKKPEEGGEKEGNRFSPPRPLDIIGCLKGGVLLIEMKGFRGVCGLSYKHLRPSQVITYDKTSKLPNAFYCNLIGYFFFEAKTLKKIVFVDYEHLKKVNLVRKSLVEAFLSIPGNGQVFGETLEDPETKKKSRKYFIDLDNLENYIIQP